MPDLSTARSVVATLSLIYLLTSLPLGVRDARAQVDNVGIGTLTPNQSAVLELSSTAKGLLIPRLTNAQMLSIASPATSLLVYNTTYTNFYYFNGLIWVPIVGEGWSITGDAGTTAGINFLGPRDSVDLVQKTNSRERMRFLANGDVGLISQSNIAEELRFFEPSGNGPSYTAFKAKAQAANVKYRLPLADGEGSSYALLTDGSARLYWNFFATFGGGGTDPVWARGNGQRTLYSLGSGNKASGQYSMSGGRDNQAGGPQSVAWGFNNKAGGNYGTVSGGQDNSALGTHTTVRGGFNNDLSGSHTVTTGGYNNNLSGAYGATAAGQNNTIAGDYTAILGGSGNNTTGAYSLFFGNGLVNGSANVVIFHHASGGPTYVGIRKNSPTEALDIDGNLRFSSILKPNNLSGTSGHWLYSAGAGSPPTWSAATAIGTNYWRLAGNTATNPSNNYIGTADAQDFAIRTTNAERLRIKSTGNIGVGTVNPLHFLHAENTVTTDELAALQGSTTGATASQSLGVWGLAPSNSGGNTGTIGILAQGNRNATASTVNAALQVSGGPLAIGRTTQGPSKGTTTEAAAAGTAYSQEGPSGVIELAFITDLSSTSPVTGVLQDLGTVTINNQYATTNSIIVAGIISKVNGGGTPNPEFAVYKAGVESRANGSFTLRISMIPNITHPGNYKTADLLRIGYIIINPGK